MTLHLSTDLFHDTVKVEILCIYILLLLLFSKKTKSALCVNVHRNRKLVFSKTVEVTKNGLELRIVFLRESYWQNNKTVLYSHENYKNVFSHSCIDPV